MASLKGGTNLWDAAAVSTSDVSSVAYIGPGPNVTLYVTSDATTTFTVEVAAEPRLNDYDSDDAPDGGLTWYIYDGGDNLSVDSESRAFDLSPFGPALIRLICTDDGGGATVTAFISSFGPN